MVYDVEIGGKDGIYIYQQSHTYSENVQSSSNITRLVRPHRTRRDASLGADTFFTVDISKLTSVHSISIYTAGGACVIAFAKVPT